MGKSTDELLEKAKMLSKHPNIRELDLLMSSGEIVSSALMSIALQELGLKAISLTGFQAGIDTNSTFGEAQIISIDNKRIHDEINNGQIVVIAGFQGYNENFEITTLGRGGSDTTAVALAASLKADICEGYTDVEGIYTADPRIVSNARKIPNIAYEEMLELASYGAKMHPRSIELGALYNVPIFVTSSFTDSSGTLINWGDNVELVNRVTGIAHDKNVAKIKNSQINSKNIGKYSQNIAKNIDKILLPNIAKIKPNYSQNIATLYSKTIAKM